MNNIVVKLTIINHIVQDFILILILINTDKLMKIWLVIISYLFTKYMCNRAINMVNDDSSQKQVKSEKGGGGGGGGNLKVPVLLYTRTCI